MKIVHIGIKIEEKDRNKLKRQAKAEHKSLSGFIRDILYEILERDKKPKAAPPVETKEE